MDNLDKLRQLLEILKEGNGKEVYIESFGVQARITDNAPLIIKAIEQEIAEIESVFAYHEEVMKMVPPQESKKDRRIAGKQFGRTIS